MALLFASLSLQLPPHPPLHANFTYPLPLLCTALVWFFHIELTFINRNPHDDGPKSSWGFPFPSSSVVHSLSHSTMYVFPWCRWRWLCPWRLLEWMLCVDQPSGGCWIFRSAGIIFVLLMLTLQCSSLFYVQYGTMVLFLGVQMKLLPIVFTNNNSSTPFHHFLLPPTFHPPSAYLCILLPDGCNYFRNFGFTEGEFDLFLRTVLFVPALKA